ncbi:MAG TPA: FliM/FliN family flagellar motor switch protein, partial [Candidatus Gastranaerophilales bacterium]|nr:FliM/FliN family flagellar motor switch protein [Candidatus Gastranaerophilales bacterium]
SSPEDKQNILDKLNNSNIPVNVLLGGTNITIEDFLDLKVGDVLRLDNSINDNLIINVKHKPKFLGRPGTKKNKLAVTITDEILNIENLKKYKGV